MAQSPNVPLLVVDDDQEIRELLAEYFGRHGLPVAAAANAAAAREQVARAAPRVAILDLHMPGEDGVSLCRWLRAQHPRVGVVMLTTAVEVVAGLEAGADDHVAKPFELRDLLARVKSLIRRLDST